MHIRSKAVFLLTLVLNMLMTPAYAVDSKPPATRPPGIGDPGDSPVRPRPRPTPAPTPPPAPVLTEVEIIAMERKLVAAMETYTKDIEDATANYNWQEQNGGYIGAKLADKELYLAGLEADLKFWGVINDIQTLLQVPFWSMATAKVALEFSAQAPVVQIKAAGMIAAVGGLSTYAASKFISQTTDELKDLIANERRYIDSQVAYILWQEDYGGLGQPPPHRYEELFPKCDIEEKCANTLVCVQNAGGKRDCDTKLVCDLVRVIRCY
jgi:hypothetical protein